MGQIEVRRTYRTRFSVFTDPAPIWGAYVRLVYVYNGFLIRIHLAGRVRNQDKLSVLERGTINKYTRISHQETRHDTSDKNPIF